MASEHNPIQRNGTSLVMQGEYTITGSEGTQPALIGTESIRGCYAATIFHPTKSCIIHWDDITRRDQLQSVLNVFRGNSESIIGESIATITGGWKNSHESSKAGDFLLQELSAQGFQKVLPIGFKEKIADDEESKCSTLLADNGFSYIALDTSSGELTISDNWQLHQPDEYYGANYPQRQKTLQYLIRTHTQDDEHKDSGRVLIDKERFSAAAKRNITELCKAARDGDMRKLVTELDNSVADINTPSSKGWTALHYACAKGKFACAKTLILSGADVNLVNDAGKSPLDLIKGHQEDKDILETLHAYVQFNVYGNPVHGLRSFAISSRHPDHIEPETKEQIEEVMSILTDAQARPVFKEQIRKAMGTS